MSRLTKLTHPNCEVYVDLDKIICIEREIRPKTSLLKPNEGPHLTMIRLDGGGQIVVLETPEEIVALKDPISSPIPFGAKVLMETPKTDFGTNLE